MLKTKFFDEIIKYRDFIQENQTITIISVNTIYERSILLTYKV